MRPPILISIKMNTAIADLIPNFLQAYDAPAKDKIWQQQSNTFRRFWAERVLSATKGIILMMSAMQSFVSWIAMVRAIRRVAMQLPAA